MTGEFITIALMGFSGMHVAILAAYVFGRDTKLNGERITPLAVRIAAKAARIGKGRR